ncbi:flagellar basal body P-ring formation chaperone FlgA [Algicola sagamiensis]|uniref:flagellar basal body P-ring formation chaperone FlgA n=1 Tax=Algicola sagamiensis TaxID=163869 RepID=UPI000360402C|nr:flagellar basal body P-ring formation chaperone FlgA [Algicola sagamiensis]
MGNLKKHFFILIRLTLILGGGIIAIPGQATNFNEIKQNLVSSASEFIYQDLLSTLSPDQKVEAQVYPIDSRIKLPNCEKFLFQQSGKTSKIQQKITLKVTCPATPKWYLYITVKLRWMVHTLTTKTMLSRGEIISSNHLILTPIDKMSMRASPITDPNLLIGAKTKRRLPHGKPITMKDICLVCKGESVTIIAGNAKFSVKVSGKALGDGTKGESVYVQNSRSGRKVNAIVLAPGIVQVKI